MQKCDATHIYFWQLRKSTSLSWNNVLRMRFELELANFFSRRIIGHSLIAAAASQSSVRSVLFNAFNLSSTEWPELMAATIIKKAIN